MIEIPFSKVLEILDKALGLQIPDQEHNPNVEFFLDTAARSEDDEEDPFLTISARNDDGLVWCYRFYEEDNATAGIDDDLLWLRCGENMEEAVGIRILVPLNLEEEART